MSDLVERLLKPVAHERREGFYTVTTYAPDPLRAEAASRISQQDAELERLRREVEVITGEAFEWRSFFEAEKAKAAEARKAAFIEAAEIAADIAQGSDHLLKAAGQAKDIQGALVHGEGVMTARIIAAALRAKADGENRG